MAAETAALRQPGGGTVADTLAEWLATRYVIAVRRLAEEAGDDGLDLATLAKKSAQMWSRCARATTARSACGWNANGVNNSCAEKGTGNFQVEGSQVEGSHP